MNFLVNIGAKTEKLKLNWKNLKHEKEIISKLSDKVKVLTKRVEILEKENEQLKKKIY